MQKRIQSRGVLLCLLSVVSGFIIGRWSAHLEPDRLQNLTVNKGMAQEEQLNGQAREETTSAGTDSFKQDVQKHRKTSIQKATEDLVRTGLADNPILPYPDLTTEIQPETDNESLKAEVAASLKENGLSDDEIEESMHGLFPQPVPEPNPPENAGELTPQQLELEVAASLRESGIPEEHINEFVKGFVAAIKPQE